MADDLFADVRGTPDDLFADVRGSAPKKGAKDRAPHMWDEEALAESHRLQDVARNAAQPDAEDSPWYDRAAKGAMGFLEAMPANSLADEAAGVGGVVKSALYTNPKHALEAILAGDPLSFTQEDPLEAYAQSRDAQREASDIAHEDPISDLGRGLGYVAQMPSAVMSGGNIVAKGAPGLAGAAARVAKGAGVGGAMGAAQGFGEGEGLDQSIDMARDQAETGAAFGGVLTAAGEAGARIPGLNADLGDLGRRAAVRGLDVVMDAAPAAGKFIGGVTGLAGGAAVGHGLGSIPAGIAGTYYGAKGGAAAGAKAADVAGALRAKLAPQFGPEAGPTFNADPYARMHASMRQSAPAVGPMAATGDPHAQPITAKAGERLPGYDENGYPIEQAPPVEATPPPPDNTIPLDESGPPMAPGQSSPAGTPLADIEKTGEYKSGAYYKSGGIGAPDKPVRATLTAEEAADEFDPGSSEFKQWLESSGVARKTPTSPGRLQMPAMGEPAPPEGATAARPSMTERLRAQIAEGALPGEKTRAVIPGARDARRSSLIDETLTRGKSARSDRHAAMDEVQQIDLEDAAARGDDETLQMLLDAQRGAHDVDQMGHYIRIGNRAGPSYVDPMVPGRSQSETFRGSMDRDVTGTDIPAVASPQDAMARAMAEQMTRIADPAERAQAEQMIKSQSPDIWAAIQKFLPPVN